MTRVIHTGDTHLGYRQYHRPERKRDFLDAFQQVADDAVDGDVDAVVHAGDLFHDRRPDLGEIMGALSVLRTLESAGIPFLAVVGNHEAKRSGQWLDLYESLGLARRLGPEPVVVGDTAFYGLDFVPRSRRDAFEPDFAPHDADHAALVTHGLFEPFDFGEWDTCEITEPADVAFDAVLLGDNHHPETAQVGDTWVTYCGSTERASAAEREERGYNLVEFDGDVDIRRRGIDTREFVFVDAELGECEGTERVRQRVAQYNLEDAVVVVTIEGDGDPVTPATIEEQALESGALVARVTDRRETPEESAREVSFADPDDAVRERVRDLGLSTAARDIDETVRESKVADSNVDSEVESHVRDLVEDGDPSLFETAPVSAAAAPANDEGVPGEDDSGSADSDGDTASAATDDDSASGEADDDSGSAEADGEAVDGTLEDFV
ncbi:DNA repair exonuclease [Halobacteriales archaeon QS_4_69_31]|nr:MAG: DNA repair exonuclease [Halobacteriales archaeon QS_4_69_31]